MNNFNSIENKELLWDLLNEKNIFLNIPDSEKENVQNIFENEIEKISIKANKDSDLLILNKLLIQNFTNELSFYKQNKNFQKEILNNEFRIKKKEFNEFINKKKPEEIKFEKEIDKPLDQNELDIKLDFIIKNRNQLIIEYDRSKNPTKLENIEKVEKEEKEEKVEKIENIEKVEKVENIENIENSKKLKYENINIVEKNKKIDIEIINNKLDKLIDKIDLLLSKINN